MTNTPASQQDARVVSIRDEQPIFEGLLNIACKAALASAAVASLDETGSSRLHMRGLIETLNEISDTARQLGREQFAAHWPRELEELS